uniref:(northern house mosquito) hypothetical protein n=1 Tax=Culex pipiens TaxID=7175 RepID=A0A8D8E3V1_CULPI
MFFFVVVIFCTFSIDLWFGSAPGWKIGGQNATNQRPICFQTYTLARRSYSQISSLIGLTCFFFFFFWFKLLYTRSYWLWSLFSVGFNQIFRLIAFSFCRLNVVLFSLFSVSE